MSNIMNYPDPFKPYSLETRGDLLTYLRERNESAADNMFLGSENFFKIRDPGIIVPEVTCLRVNRSPIPDVRYIVNGDYQLESSGQGQMNMSLIGADEGLYDPIVALEDAVWSIHQLRLWDEHSECS